MTSDFKNPDFIQLNALRLGVKFFAKKIRHLELVSPLTRFFEQLIVPAPKVVLIATVNLLLQLI